jgi:tRNA/rRNA methyltransferase
VLLIGYSLFRAAAPSIPPPVPPPPPATAARREELHRHLEAVLLRIGFLRPGHRGQVLPRLRRLFGRAVLEEREVRILRGILSQIEWALDQERTGGGSKETR